MFKRAVVDFGIILMLCTPIILFAASTRMDQFCEVQENPALLQDYQGKKWFLALSGSAIFHRTSILLTPISERKAYQSGIMAYYRNKKFVYFAHISEWLYARRWDPRTTLFNQIGETNGMLDLSVSWTLSTESDLGLAYHKTREGDFDPQTNSSVFSAKETLLFVKKEDRLSAGWRCKNGANRYAAKFGVIQREVSGSAINRQALLGCYWGHHWKRLNLDGGIEYLPESLAVDNINSALFEAQGLHVKLQGSYLLAGLPFSLRYLGVFENGLATNQISSITHQISALVTVFMGTKQVMLFTVFSQTEQLTRQSKALSIGVSLGDFFE